MKSYAELEVFSKQELSLWARATEFVSRLPTKIGGEYVRCHELARAAGVHLGLQVCDGRFGFVEHSWLWTSHFDVSLNPWVLPNVLDVYVPGSLPQVQLVHMQTGLPTRYAVNPINDLVVRDNVVEELLSIR